jgi:hypothetical protein
MSGALRAAVLVPLLAAAAAAQVRFDQGVDVKAALRLLRAETASVATPQTAPAAAPKAASLGRHLYWMAGCREVTLAPGASRSALVDLSSTEIVEECDVFPNPQCRQTFGFTVRKNARLVAEGRATPGAETFKLCLMGEELSVDLTTQYTQVQQGDTLILRPQR